MVIPKFFLDIIKDPSNLEEISQKIRRISNYVLLIVGNSKKPYFYIYIFFVIICYLVSKQT